MLRKLCLKVQWHTNVYKHAHVVIITIWLYTPPPSPHTHFRVIKQSVAPGGGGEDAALAHQSSLNFLSWCQECFRRAGDTCENRHVLAPCITFYWKTTCIRSPCCDNRPNQPSFTSPLSIYPCVWSDVFNPPTQSVIPHFPLQLCKYIKKKSICMTNGASSVRWSRLCRRERYKREAGARRRQVFRWNSRTWCVILAG